MNKVWNGLADFFELTFNVIDGLGNTMNYIYIAVIFLFLVIWVLKMIKHRNDNEEHASL